MISLARYILFSMLVAPSITWTERTGFPEPRAGYIAGELQGKLMIAGGSYWQNDRKIYSRRADVFDAVGNRWLPLPELSHARSDAGCATLENAVYAFGGVVDGKLADSIVRLDANGWSTLEIKLPEPSMYGMAVAAEKEIFLVGGLSVMGDLSSASRTFLKWQPGGTWKRLADFPGSPRVSAAIASSGGKIYVFGGAHMAQAGASVQNLDDVWSYDRSQDRWMREATLPVARRAWSAVAAEDHIFLIGGYTSDFSNEIYSFNPHTRETARAGQLPHALADAKYVKIGNNIFTAGGESGIKIRGPWTFQGTLRSAAR